MKKIRAKLKSGEEITTIKDCKEFSGENFIYSSKMNKIALEDKILDFEQSDVKEYDYSNNKKFYVKKEWLKEIKEEEINSIGELINKLIPDLSNKKYWGYQIQGPSSLNDKPELILTFTESIINEEKKYSEDTSLHYKEGKTIKFIFKINLSDLISTQIIK